MSIISSTKVVNQIVALEEEWNVDKLSFLPVDTSIRSVIDTVINALAATLPMFRCTHESIYIHNLFYANVH